MKKKSIFAVLLLLMITIYPSTMAKATVLGGKWTSDFNCCIQTTNYYSNVYNAILAWNSKLDYIGSNIDISTSNSSYSVTISQISDLSVPWNGITQIIPYTRAVPYTGAIVQLNDYYLKNHTSAQNTSTATHEMGHVLGLDETADWKEDSLMITDFNERVRRGLLTIQTYDEGQLNNLY